MEPITCLVADDELMRQPVADGLSEAPGIQVLEVASDGHALLELIAWRRPDVVIADVALAGVDGLSVCRHVAQRVPDARVILCGGAEDFDQVETALEAGASGFVVAAAHPSHLVRAVKAAMRSQVYIDAPLVEGLLRVRGERRRPPFSGRERQVLGLLAEGFTSEEIAGRLFLTVEAVHVCAERALDKLDAADQRDPIAQSLRLGVRR